MFMTAIPVGDLRPGDTITTDDTDVTVDDTEVLDGGLVRVHGRITRGFGASHRGQRWTFAATETVDIERNE